MSSSRQLLIALLVLTTHQSGRTADLGRIGPTYKINEPDMLEWIERKVAGKVASGEALRYQQQQAEKMRQKLLHPEPLASVSKASKDRIIYFDPTLTVHENITNESGQILVPAGTAINPLDRITLSRPLIFFDARDPNQRAFAKRFIDTRAGLAKAILVGGSYFELMKQWQTPVFFDQQSALIRRLGIQHVPAIVEQEGKRLRIHEIAL